MCKPLSSGDCTFFSRKHTSFCRFLQVMYCSMISLYPSAVLIICDFLCGHLFNMLSIHLYLFPVLQRADTAGFLSYHRGDTRPAPRVQSCPPKGHNRGGTTVEE